MDYISMHDLHEFCTSDFLLRKLEKVLQFSNELIAQ